MTDPPDREVAVFGAAVQLPAGQRAAYLDEACAGDAALRQRVEAFLAAHVEAGAFLEGPTPEAERASANQRVANQNETLRLTLAPPQKPGDLIGRYKIREQVGEGGCGVVYVAEQTEPVHRRVALKVIKLGMDTRNVIARFEAERQAVAMMDHPNIAKVLDAGTTDTGRPYFVMELVRGIKITDYCDQNNLSIHERLELFVQVCHAVQHAHQKGIIHRDIKPSNILVTLHDGVPVPKVIDFGIAKATEGRLTTLTVYTELNQFIGTPAYMSPEQAEMSGLDIDTRSDIYSLGVLLYELLGGSTPFDAKDLMASGIEAMRKTIREKEPVRPSTRLATLQGKELTTTAKRRSVDAPKLIHLLKGDLDWIVMKCLEKDRTRRYETANGLAMDLKRHLNNEPVMARPPSNLYRLQKLIRRNKLAFAAATAIVVTLILGLSVSTALFLTEQAARRRAVALERDQRRLRGEAVEAAKKAETQELAARQSAYAADMVIAQQAYTAGNYGRVIALLDRHRPDKTKSLNPQPATDLRGWEWRYLWQLALGNENFILGRHTNSAYAIAFSPSGRLLASAGGDKILRLWDLKTRREKTAMLLPGLITLQALAYSPDGAFLAAATSGSAGRRLTIWDGTTLQEVKALDPTNCLYFSFSPNGAFLAAGAGNELKLWETGTWRERPGWRSDKKLVHQGRFRTTEEVNVEVSDVAIAANNRTVAFGTTDGRIHLWDAESRQHTTEWPAHEPNPRAFDSLVALVFSPNGRTLVSVGEDDQIKVWDVGTQQQRTNLMEQAAGQAEFGPRSLAFSPDGATLAASGADQTLRLWDTSTWSRINVLKGHRGEVYGVAFSPDGKILASASADETIRLWDLAATIIQNPFHKYPDDILIGGLSQGGRYVGMGHRNGSLSLWDTATMRKKSEGPGLEIEGHDFAVISPDGSYAAFAFRDGSIRLTETVQTKKIVSWPAHAAGVRALCFSEDGSLLASVGDDRTVRLWEIATHQERWKASFSNDLATPGIRISAHNEFLCVGDDEGWVRVWDIRTGKLVHSLKAHNGWILGLAISADARTLVTCSFDGTAKLWLLAATNQPPVTLHCSSRGVYAVALSPDARRLAVLTREGAVKLWDLATDQEISTFQAQARLWATLAFLPDGNTLVLNGDKGIYVWRVPSWAEIEGAEAKLAKEGQPP